MVIVSDSIPQNRKLKVCKKLHVFSIAKLLSEVVVRISNNQSVSEIFKMERVGSGLFNSGIWSDSAPNTPKGKFMVDL